MFSRFMGCALNVVLDPVAIFCAGMGNEGMKGAALAAIYHWCITGHCWLIYCLAGSFIIRLGLNPSA